MTCWPPHLYRVADGQGGWHYIVEGLQETPEREAGLAQSHEFSMQQWPPSEAETIAAAGLYAAFLKTRN